MECADGYWNWEFGGFHYQTVPQTCFQSSPGWPYWVKSSPNYGNDSSTLGKFHLVGDGISFHYNSLHDPNVNDTAKYPKWWGSGKQESNSCNVGTDGILVNEEEIYTKAEFLGDRYDAWLPGYNEIFSHYSSPSSLKWDNTNSNILIWFDEEDHGEASLKIYKVGENGYSTYDDILEVTPPSRPLGLKEETCVYINGQNRPKISWVHNREPDMVREDQIIENRFFKRYKVYRSVATDMGAVPPDAHSYSENVYTFVATVDIDTGTTPTYIDTALISGCYLPDGQCPPNCWIQYPLRYRIQAIDVYDDESVLSDFIKTTGLRTDNGDPGGKEEDERPTSGLDIPTVFDLKQNFPNPFNPSTNIQYDIPKDVHVSIKIYDMIGREMAVLVNDFRNAGRHIVAYNGSYLASGIYFYKIKAGSFEQTRRMVLVK